MRRFIIVMSLLSLSVPTLRADDSEPRSGWLFVLPVFMYSPETEFGFGASSGRWIQFDDPATTRRSSLTPVLIYTTRSQIISLLAGDLWWGGDDWHAEGLLAYSDFPMEFYGTGNATRDADEETFTSRSLTIDLSLKRRLGASFYTGPRLFIEDLGLDDVAADGALAEGTLPGSTGGTLTGLGWDLVWDSRDAQFYPTRGSFHELRLLHLDDALGGAWASPTRRR